MVVVLVVFGGIVFLYCFGVLVVGDELLYVKVIILLLCKWG